MKINIIKSIFALSILSVTATPALAQTWTDGSGAPLAVGTSITMAGPLLLSVLGPPTTCNMSFDGTVTASDTITFHSTTPGFVTNCAAPQFPFDMKAQFSGSSFTGERATALSLVFNTPIGTCTTSSFPFAWYDSSFSEAQLHATVTAFPCTLHAGSRLTVAGALAGYVDIR